MSITEEQFKLFNKNFEVIETTSDVSEYKAKFDFDDIQEYLKDNDSPDDFFLEVNWDLKSSEPFESKGYSIINKSTEETIKKIICLDDIVHFINEEMDNHLK